MEADGWALAPEQLRFLRRAVRDAKFRSAPVDITIQQWKSIRRGERLYIDPYRSFVAYEIDSYLPYETYILMQLLREEVLEKAETLTAAGLEEVFRAASAVRPIDYAPYIPEASVLHEFIG